MYKITVTKVNEDEEQTITRKYDDGCQDEVFEEAIIEMIDQLKDSSTIEEHANKYKAPGHDEVMEALSNLTIKK